MKRSTPWWMNFQIVAWVVGGLTALGTVTVMVARYIELPQKVEAAQQKNVEQDESINTLTAIQKTWQNIYQQQQQIQQRPANAPVTVKQPPARMQKPDPPAFREWDETDRTFWCCDLGLREDCWKELAWYRC